MKCIIKFAAKFPLLTVSVSLYSSFILLLFFLSANIYLTCFRVQIKLNFPLFPFFLTVYSDQTADIG